MATLGDIISEMFAPQPNVGSYARLGGPGQETLDVPLPDPITTVGEPPQKSVSPGLVDVLRRMFAGTPQPPDGMDAATFTQTRKAPPMPERPNLSAPPVVEKEWGPDSNEGYAKTFGFVPPADNDQARAAQMVPSQYKGAVPAAARPAPAPPPSRDVPMQRPGSAPVAEPANSDLARAFRAFFAGAAGVNPASPAFSAFAQGASGAMKTQFDERQKDALLSRQREKDSLDQALRLTKNDREEALADNLMKYRDRKSGTEAGAVRFQDIRGYNDVKNNIARDYKRAKDLINKDYTLGPAEKKKAEADALAERDARLAEVEQQYKQRSLTPDMSKAPQKGEPKAAPKTGDGKSPQAPVDTRDPKVIESLPKGSYFINPADGQVYQKN